MIVYQDNKIHWNWPSSSPHPHSLTRKKKGVDFVTTGLDCSFIACSRVSVTLMSCSITCDNYYSSTYKVGHSVFLNISLSSFRSTCWTSLVLDVEKKRKEKLRNIHYLDVRYIKLALSRFQLFLFHLPFRKEKPRMLCIYAKTPEQLMGIIGWNDSELQKYSSLAVLLSHFISKIFVFKMKMMLLSGNAEWLMDVFNKLVM